MNSEPTDRYYNAKRVTQWELLKDLFYALLITPAFFTMLILIIKFSSEIDAFFNSWFK